MNMNQNQQQQQQQQQIQKKKFNKAQYTRKVQHFKRKYRKSNKHKRTISNQTTDYFLKQANLREQIVEEEEVEEEEEEGPTSLFMSPSSMTKKKFYPLHILSKIDPFLFLPDYSMMSNVNLKQMLLTLAVEHFGVNFLDEFLDSDEKFTFTRQLIQLTNKLNYTKLQDEQWTYYYNFGIAEGTWTRRVSKKMALDNSMCYTYGRRKQLIAKRRKYFQKKFRAITDKIQKHLKRTSCSSIDTNRLIGILNDLVDKDQYQLRRELERRKHMLKFDAKDHQLVEAFYQRKPRKTEVRSKTSFTSISYIFLYIYLDTISKNYLESNS
jgi:hypothetical protein